MINCLYCGTGLKEDEGSCHKCGAPAGRKSNLPQHYGHTPYGKCVCGLTIFEETVILSVKNILCHKCFNIFTDEFRAQYVEDWRYPNGQISHVFSVAGLECPHCGAIFEAHEFYHGLTDADDVEGLISHAKRARAEV